jgi:hypothetical protein
VSRIVDRGAVTAAYVGIGVAITIAVSFLLIIPIEPVIWLLSIPAGLVIGYYANQRSDRRRGPWSRILRNGVFAGFVTGLATAALILVLKSIFYFADTGYPDFNRADQDGMAIPPFCQTGGDCVYHRYLARNGEADLRAAGATDAASFGALYWNQQFTVAGALLIATTLGGVGGAAMYGVMRPKPTSGAGQGQGSVAAPAAGPGQA